MNGDEFDQKYTKHVQAEADACLSENSWKKIKSKDLKDKLIRNFAIACCEKLSPSTKPSHLEALIHNGIKYRQILNTDFILKDNKLKKITSLKFRNDIFVLSREAKALKTTKNSLPKSRLSTLAREYVKDLKLRVNKFNI